METKQMRSKRFEKLAERPVNQETFIRPWPKTCGEPPNSPACPMSKFWKSMRHCAPGAAVMIT